MFCDAMAGPEAVTYIVNHADIQDIFCVPITLNTL
ncbi:Long chain acyl-CoA synthetase 7 peroxisomal [Orobanche minor]